MNIEETREYDLLQHIKFCLECKNESQAIRLIEQYGFQKQEERYSEEEVLDLFVGILDANKCLVTFKDIKEWFEQNKNK